MKLKLSIICAAALSAAMFFSVPDAEAKDDSGMGLHTVVIDPGHGGKDPGAISRDRKTQEKALVLKISKLLKEKIEASHKDVEVLLTREKDDVLVPLIDRARFATKKEADLFISVHINDNPRTTPNGYSIHLLGPSTDKNKDTYAFNMDVCKRENSVILLEEDYSTTYQGFDPNDPESDIFLHLMHNSYREQSLIFAQLVDEKLSQGPIKASRGITQNNFAVLRQASMPAVLLELGFISNPADLEVLRSSASLEKLASRLADAFTEYKAIYDESVGETTSRGTVSQGPEKAVKTDVSAEAEKPEEVFFGTQVLASSRLMKDNDPYFLGYEVRHVKSGSLYKYIIGISEDVEKARETAAEIRKKYPDSFLVKVDNNACTLVR